MGQKERQTATVNVTAVGYSYSSKDETAAAAKLVAITGVIKTMPKTYQENITTNRETYKNIITNDDHNNYQGHLLNS